MSAVLVFESVFKGLVTAPRTRIAVGLETVLEPIEESCVSHPKLFNHLSIINISKFFRRCSSRREEWSFLRGGGLVE